MRLEPPEIPQRGNKSKHTLQLLGAITSQKTGLLDETFESTSKNTSHAASVALCTTPFRKIPHRGDDRVIICLANLIAEHVESKSGDTRLPSTQPCPLEVLCFDFAKECITRVKIRDGV